MSSADIEIASSDVVKLLLQFCAENGLTKTFEALQEESKVSLNTVSDKETFMADVKNGRWDAVLKAINNMTLPNAKLLDLYEQIIVELIELREVDVAKALMKETDVMRHMDETDHARYARLEQLCSKTFFDVRDAYPDGSSQKKRRTLLAGNLGQEVAVVPPSRLLTLLDHALKWQQQQGLLPPGETYDLFKGVARQKVDTFETYPTVMTKSIQFGKKSTPEVAQFSPSGGYFVTGTMDGFIEVWNPETGKIRKDLPYQKNEDSPFMMHKVAVLCIAFSHDSELLASGSQDGAVRVWNPATGQCLRRFDRAHQKGVTALKFNKDASQVLTGSFDATARVHGLRSGKAGIKEFRGHRSYVNDVAYAADGARVITASSDGTCRVWDHKTMETLYEVSSAGASVGDPPPCLQVVPMPATDTFILCCRAPTLSIIDSSGRVIRTLSSGQKEASEFVACTASPKGEFIYALGEDSVLYCFDAHKGKLEHSLKVSEKDVVGLTHHPHRNYIATWGQDSYVKLWVPG